MLYSKDPFRVLRAALSELCENAIYAEHEMSQNPCPEYLAELYATSRAIYDAGSIEDLAAVAWVSRKAVLGAENMDSALEE